MERIRKSRDYWLTAIRWTTRILAALLAALVLLLVLCHAFSVEGLPNPFKQPPQIQLEFAGMLAMWAGWILGWKWEGISVILAVSGMLIFHTVEGRIWLNGGVCALWIGRYFVSGQLAAKKNCKNHLTSWKMECNIIMKAKRQLRLGL